MRILLALLVAPAIVLAQTSFPTEFPSGALPLSPHALKQRLLGKVFTAKSMTGPDVRTEYRDTYADINVGNTSDSGTWKTEGSAVCYEWQKLRPGCSEIRVVGDTLYVKRTNNGEIMTLTPK